MPGLSYDKCITSGHQAWPPTEVNATQSKVFTDGKPVIIEGDKITPHTETKDPYERHDGVVQPRTSKVFVGGIKAGGIGDPISCGDTIAQSSSKVFIH